MRSALICLFLILIVQKEGSCWAAIEDNFRPTPIPLKDWHYERHEDRAGMLQETIETTASSTIAVVPAHYWEDALRHSVYLTLVRDKIDQLIAKSQVITPGSKGYSSKENDDHDLWDRIKSAPFERVETEETPALGDFTIMAKGKLMEEGLNYRFVEDNKTSDKCNDDKCKEGVKAFWSVKRVRQRDVETSPGRYHYELTFSVITQAPKKEAKTYENPARTFTVKETSPEKIVGPPQEYRYYQPVRTQRPERAIWIHKNISNRPRYLDQKYHYDLDRIFTSFFEDDYEPQSKPKYITQSFPQYSKLGYVGASSEQYYQKKLVPYPYKPHTYKYSRPPLPPQPPQVQHHYLDIDAIGVVSNPYVSHTPHDHRHGSPHKSKTPRPPFLPTPIDTQNLTAEISYKWRLNATESTTRPTEIITGSNSYLSKPLKVSYFPDHVRPPVYNAPPGVFVTMDKKPFKPMPPLRLVQSSKPVKPVKPTDFRPSPQLLDIQFSEPDPLFDTAFRPITVNYVENNTTEKIEIAETIDHDAKPKTSNRKKPPKKHENIKSHRLTTTTPDIITTVQTESEEERDTMQWANVLGAFTKTTPMASHKTKVKVIENTPSPSTSTTVATTTARKRTTTERKTTTTSRTTTTTPKPKKRTRPPPKFVKPEKPKKHHRVTSTTTKAPHKFKKPDHDLTPQASSSATSTIQPWQYPWSKAESTTTPKPSTTSPHTTSTTQTTTSTPISTTEAEVQPTSTKPPNNKNRYRQSTLIHKGTSIKHDRWSNQNQQNIVQRVASPITGTANGRRKASNFQGYVMTSTPTHSDIVDVKEHHHQDHAFTPSQNALFENTTPQQTLSSSDPHNDGGVINKNNELEIESQNHEENFYDIEQIKEEDVQESRDHTEYTQYTEVPNEQTNEIIESVEPSTTEKIVTPVSKPKCNKIKHLTTTTTTQATDNEDYEEEEENIEVVPSSTAALTITTTSTENAVTPDIFDEIFGGFTFDDADDKRQESPSTEKPILDEQQSSNKEQYLKIDDDLKDFLDSLEEKHEDKHSDDSEEQYEDEDPSIEDEETLYEDENDDNNETIERDISNKDSSDKDHHISLLELIAME